MKRRITSFFAWLYYPPNIGGMAFIDFQMKLSKLGLLGPGLMMVDNIDVFEKLILEYAWDYIEVIVTVSCSSIEYSWPPIKIHRHIEMDVCV